MRTLRDFGWNNCPKREGWEGSCCPNCGTNHTATEEYMKQVAIEWVKELMAKHCPPQSSIITWIKVFFGLTEEDLGEKITMVDKVNVKGASIDENGKISLDTEIVESHEAYLK